MKTRDLLNLLQQPFFNFDHRSVWLNGLGTMNRVIVRFTQTLRLQKSGKGRPIPTLSRLERGRL